MKLTKKDIKKIRQRFNKMYDEYMTKSLDELKEIFNTKKLSSTDREALVQCVNQKLIQEKNQTIKDKVDEIKEIGKETSKEEIKENKED